MDGGGSAQFITILHKVQPKLLQYYMGGGPKLYHVIYEQPLKVMFHLQVGMSRLFEAGVDTVSGVFAAHKHCHRLCGHPPTITIVKGYHLCTESLSQSESMPAPSPAETITHQHSPIIETHHFKTDSRYWKTFCRQLSDLCSSQSFVAYTIANLLFCCR